MEAVTGIVLCGGKSRRMGTNKALLELGGKYIISHVIETLSHFSREIIISTNSADLNFPDIKIVADELNNIGPIAGIYSALKASSNRKNIILSCDTPFITREFIAFMLEKSQGFDVLLPVFNGFLQPMTGVFDKKLTPHIEKEISSGNYIPPNIFEKTKINKLPVTENTPGYHKHLFFNINSPADYEQAQQIQAAL